MSATATSGHDDEVGLHRLRLRALACIRESRFRLYVADRNWDFEFGQWRPSLAVLAHVASSQAGRGPYEVRFLDGVWTCTCRDREQDVCKHRLAVAIVTGHAYPGNRPVHPE